MNTLHSLTRRSIPPCRNHVGCLRTNLPYTLTHLCGNKCLSRAPDRLSIPRCRRLHPSESACRDHWPYHWPNNPNTGNSLAILASHDHFSSHFEIHRCTESHFPVPQAPWWQNCLYCHHWIRKDRIWLLFPSFSNCRSPPVPGDNYWDVQPLQWLYFWHPRRVCRRSCTMLPSI